MLFASKVEGDIVYVKDTEDNTFWQWNEYIGDS